MDQASCNSDQDDDILIVEEFNDNNVARREKHVVVLESSDDDESESDEDDDIVIIENNEARSAERPDEIEIFDIDENARGESDSDQLDEYDEDSDDDIVIIAENSDNNGRVNNKQADVSTTKDVAIRETSSGAITIDALLVGVAGTSTSGETSAQYLNLAKIEPLYYQQEWQEFKFDDFLDMDINDVKLPDFDGLSFLPRQDVQQIWFPEVKQTERFETMDLSPENLKRRVSKCDLKVLLVLDGETQNLIKIAMAAKNITLHDLLDQIKTDYYLNYLDSTRVALVLDPTFEINYIIDIKPDDDTHWQKTAVTQELIDAVENNDLNSVRNLLAKKLLPTNIETFELMKSALKKGNSGVIKKLINHGAPVVFNEDLGQDTLLHYAAKLEDETVVKTLLYFDAELYAGNEKNETPMHVATKSDNGNVVDKLLTHLVSTHRYHNIVDVDGLSLFHIVCMGQNSSYVVNFLENIDIAVNDTISPTSSLWPGYSALHLAVNYCRYDTVQILLQRGASLEARTAKDLSAFQLACKMDFDWMVRESVPHDLFDFFERDLKLDYFKKNFDRLLRSRARIIETLIDADCDVDARDGNGNNALMNLVSVDISKPDVMNGTREKLAKENINDSELLRSLLEARLESVRKILQHCTDRWFLRDTVNSKNKFGFTCLHLTIRTNSEESHAIFKLLLQHGADVNACSKQFVTPLHVATVKNHHRFVSLVLHSGEGKLDKMANVNAQDRNGNTPLHNKYSCIDWSKSVCNCVYSLLSFGTDISIENEYGSTIYSLLSTDIARILSDEFFDLEVNDYDNTVDFNIDLKNDDFNPSQVRIDQARSHKNDVVFVAELWKHFVKLKLCNHYGNPCTDYFLEQVANKLHVNEKSIVSRAKFIHDCEQEVTAMKAISINKFVTLNDILCKHIDAVAACTEDNVLRDILESPTFKDQFPMYAKLVEGRYVRASVRSSLLKEANASLRSMIKHDIPELCLRKILRFVNEKKLRDIIEAHKLQCRVDSVIVEPSGSQEPRQKIARIF